MYFHSSFDFGPEGAYRSRHERSHRLLIINFNIVRALRSFLLVSFFLTQNSYGAPALRIVGSSAVFPFAATVAEHLKYKTHDPMPIIESIGTGAGIKLFCGDLKGADGVITSRPFTKREEEKCKDNGIAFQKFTIGLDGLVLIQNKQAAPILLTMQGLDQVLSEKVQLGKNCINNPYKEWDQIDATLDSQPIRILGPAPSTGTYDILIEKIKNTCGPFIRHDKAYIEAPANENLIVQKVLSRADTAGIVTFSFYDQNRTRLKPILLNGVLPSVKSIQDKTYPLSRPLYVYIKTNDLAHHGTRRTYALEFTSREAVGEKGYLTEKGLVPLSPSEQQEMQERARALQKGEEG